MLNEKIKTKLLQMGYSSLEYQLFFFAISVATENNTDPFELTDYFIDKKDSVILTKEFLEFKNNSWKIKDKYIVTEKSKSAIIVEQLKKELTDRGHPLNLKEYSIWSSTKKLIAILDKYEIDDVERAIKCTVDYYKHSKYSTKLETFFENSFEAAYYNYIDYGDSQSSLL